MTLKRVAPSVSLLMLAFALQAATADVPAGPGDWPAWRGADRTGISKETGLLKQWPKEGPPLVWKIKGLGDGFSTPAVAGGKIFVVGTRQGKNEHVICLSAADGKELWATHIGQMTGGHPGPRCTPTVDGDRVYAISSDGKLACLTADRGEKQWGKDFRADYAGRAGGWAYAESPLVDGSVLVCTPGGDKATLVALNKLTGEEIWKASLTGLSAKKKRAYTTAGYSSVIAAEVSGIKQYIQFLDGGVVGVAAKDGAFLWHYDNPANGTANCSTPIYHDGAVFAASAYGTGGGLARLIKNGDKFEAKEEYFIKAMQNHHGGMLLVGDHVYGTGSATLLCVDIKTGKVAWNERSVGKGSVAYADGRLYVRSEGGPLALVEATPSGYKEHGRFSQPDRSNKQAWPHPVIAGGKLYVRDWDILLCYDIKDKSVSR